MTANYISTGSVTLSGDWVAPATVNYPWYGWNWYGNHPPKCPNCGYCSCCGRADVRPEDGPVPGDGSDGGVHGAEGA